MIAHDKTMTLVAQYKQANIATHRRLRPWMIAYIISLQAGDSALDDTPCIAPENFSIPTMESLASNYQRHSTP